MQHKYRTHSPMHGSKIKLFHGNSSISKISSCKVTSLVSVEARLAQHPQIQESKMCYRYVRVYSCGHERRYPIDFCPKAKVSVSGRKTMCNDRRTTERVSDPDTCGDTNCFLNSLKRRGWTCCQCGESGNRMDGCIGPPGGEMSCTHFVCTRCRYS